MRTQNMGLVGQDAPPGNIFFETQLAEFSSRMKPVIELCGNPYMISVLKAKFSLHGTTIGSFRIANNEGIAFSDGRISQGHLKESDSYNKMRRIDKHSIFLISGVLSFADEISQRLHVITENYAKKYYTPLTTRAKVKRIQEFLRVMLPLVLQELVVVPILATYDIERGMRIFGFSADGSAIEHDNFLIGGSGRIAEGMMTECWKPDMSVREGISLARKFVSAAADKDSASGGSIFVKILTKDGVVDSEEVAS